MVKTSSLLLEVVVILSLRNTFKRPTMEVDGKKVSTYQFLSMVMKLWLPKIIRSSTQLEIGILQTTTTRTSTSLHAPTASQTAHGPKSLPNYNMVVKIQLP